MAKTSKSLKRIVKKKVSKNSIVIPCDTEAEVLLPFFQNVVQVLNEQIQAAKMAKPRRKVQKRISSGTSRKAAAASTSTGRVTRKTRTPKRTIRKKATKTIPKVNKKQSIIPNYKRKSLLPYFNISVRRAPRVSSNNAPAPSEPHPEPAPVQVQAPAAVGGPNTAGVSSIDPNYPAPNEAPQAGASPADIFSVMRNNLTNICNGVFAPQNSPSEPMEQGEPEAQNQPVSNVNIFDCLSKRMYKDWNN